MTAKPLKQRGFTAIDVLIVLVVVVILGGTGHIIWIRSNNANKSAKSGGSDSSSTTATAIADSAKKQSPQPPAYKITTSVPPDWKNYSNAKYKFSFSYPSIISVGVITQNFINWGTIPGELVSALASPKPNGPGIYPESFQVNVTKQSLTQTLSYEKNYLTSPPLSMTKLITSMLTFKGHNAYEIDIPAPDSAITKVYLIAANGYTYDVKIGIPPHAEDASLDALDKDILIMFDSLEFN